MRKLMVVCIAALFVVGLVASAEAAVQNVKVSGGITARGIVHEDYDLDANDDSTAPGTDGTDAHYMSTTTVQVDADLTDNVSAQIQLLNQRDWDGVEPANGTATGADSDVLLNLANVSLKEFLYAPLTLVIGRQNLQYGDGFIVGPGLLRNTNVTLAAGEYSAANSFDAIRAILDCDPWTVDLVISKMDENNSLATAAQTQDDVDLWGLNVGYDFNNDWNAEAEAYLFRKRDDVNAISFTEAVGTHTYEERELYTLGFRGSIAPIENLSLRGEGAYQFGEYRDTAITAGEASIYNQDRDASAWAFDVSGKYSFADVQYTPSLAVGYVYKSGESATASGDVEQWDSFYTGKFYGAIRDFFGSVYQTADANDTSGTTNSNIFWVQGTAAPLEDVTLSAKYLHYWFDEKPVAGRDDEVGDEVVTQAVYNYTEDVTLDLVGAWFLPGSYYQNGQDDTATSVVGSVSVAF